ncbi:MAG: hypothetical protein PHS83_06765 [Clostridia bacterium]|nr:hypothetical protein [Clostridia bacterium]
MSMVKNLLKDELERLKRMEIAYQKKVNELPKGVIVEKQIYGKKYPYLQRRQGNKVISIYLKHDDVDIIMKQVKERKSHEKSLKNIKEDIDFIKRALR